MRAPRWLMPAAVVLASVGWAVALAAYARGGPRREIVLGQREVGHSYTKEDDTALWLTIRWVMVDNAGRGGWVGNARLAAFGLDTIPADGPGAADGYAVLELDGPAFQQYLAARMAEQERQLNDTLAKRDSILGDYRKSLEQGTRLVLVDVGPEAGALVARYADPSRYLIMRADVRTAVNWEPREVRVPGQPVQYDSVMTSFVNVRGERMLVSGEAALPFRASRWPLEYDVTVATGRGYVPWVVGVKERR